jgi:class 3 adenylate cyclase
MLQSCQLVALMFTDIAGYTALTGNDEETAFRVLNKTRALQNQLLNNLMEGG